MKYSVDTAENGQVALDKIAAGREQYGLVLMDCQVSLRDSLSCSGLTLLHRCRCSTDLKQQEE